VRRVDVRMVWKMGRRDWGGLVVVLEVVVVVVVVEDG
jgi:hypothetical protein